MFFISNTKILKLTPSKQIYKGAHTLPVLSVGTEVPCILKSKDTISDRNARELGPHAQHVKRVGTFIYFCKGL